MIRNENSQTLKIFSLVRFSVLPRKTLVLKYEWASHHSFRRSEVAIETIVVSKLLARPPRKQKYIKPKSWQKSQSEIVKLLKTTWREKNKPQPPKNNLLEQKLKQNDKSNLPLRSNWACFTHPTVTDLNPTITIPSSSLFLSRIKHLPFYAYAAAWQTYHDATKSIGLTPKRGKKWHKARIVNLLDRAPARGTPSILGLVDPCIIIIWDTT